MPARSSAGGKGLSVGCRKSLVQVVSKEPLRPGSASRGKRLGVGWGKSWLTPKQHNTSTMKPYLCQTCIDPCQILTLLGHLGHFLNMSAITQHIFKLGHQSYTLTNVIYFSCISLLPLLFEIFFYLHVIYQNYMPSKSLFV